MRLRTSPLAQRSHAARFGPASFATSALLSSTIVGRSASAEEPPLKPDAIDFNRDIRPILSENCFQCHGPDKNKRKAKLRLDQREVALALGALVPGQPEDSEMIYRINAADPDDRMPPVDSNRHLTDAQKAILKRW